MSQTVVGKTIGKYQVTSFLRAGRMGDLYLAKHEKTKQTVTLKLLDPTLFDNEEAVQRFEREAVVTAKIQHPCCMRVYESGDSSSGAYLILEHVKGGHLLEDIIDDHAPIDANRAVLITARIAMALQAAHDVGVIHRDLAPSNILVTSGDNVKVTDFGLSSIEDESTDASNLTAVGVRIGTPSYMAPEYIEDFVLDHRADLYGLGVVLFELLTGHPPFEGRPYKVMEMHVNSPAPVPSAEVKSVPPWIDSLVAAMLAKTPEKRPQSANAIVAFIEKHLGQSTAPTSEEEAITDNSEAAEPETNNYEPDPLLSRFISTKIISKEPLNAHAKLAHCYVVERVAELCVASTAGIVPGSLISLPEATSSGLLAPDLESEIVAEQTYDVFLPSGAAFRLRCTGIPLGVELYRSPDNVILNYDPLRPDPAALLDLWKGGAWDALEKLSWRTLVQRKSSGSMLSGWFGQEKIKLHDHPALLFYGLALIEQGQSDKGHSHVAHYRTKFSSHWPAHFAALTMYAEAMVRAQHNSTSIAIDLLREAWRIFRTVRIGAVLYKLTNEMPPMPTWIGRQFSDYSMDSIDRTASIKLSAQANQLDETQYIAICMMGGFRGSLSYDEFMHRFVVFSGYFSEIIVELHVVTTAVERDSTHPEYYRGEDLAIQSRLPVFILEDYRALVQRAVKPPTVPTVYLVNRNGICVHEGRLTGAELWEALTRGAEARMQHLRG